MKLKKTKYFLLIYLAISLLSNFFASGGQWARTTETLFKAEGHYKDHYPVNDVLYAGKDTNGNFVMCVKARPYLDEKPSKIREFNHYRPKEYGIQINKHDLANPLDNFYAVKFTEKYTGKDAFLYAYAIKDKVIDCPSKTSLSLFTIEKVETGTLGRAYPASKNVYRYYHDQDEAAYIIAMNKLFPAKDNKTIYLVNYMRPDIYINHEHIKVTSTSGDTTSIYLPPGLFSNIRPVILSGGYKQYDKDINYFKLIPSVLMDIIIEPIYLLVRMVMLVGFLSLGPA